MNRSIVVGKVETSVDLIAALVGFVVGIAAVLVSEYYVLSRAHLGYATCVSCLLYLGVRKWWSGEACVDHSAVKERPVTWVFGLCAISCLLFLSASIVVLGRTPISRSPVYLGLFAIAVVLTVVQIVALDLREPWKQYVLLGQILGLGISFRAGAFFLYPTVSGIDPFFHQRWIEELIVTGSFPQGTMYASFPALHLIAGAVSLVTDGTSKLALFSISVVQSIALLSAYPMGKSLFGSRAGLLAALLLSLSEYQICWGVQVIPMTLGVVWFTLVLLALVKRDRASSQSFSWTLLILLLICVMLFTHTLSTMILVVSLVALSGVAVYSRLVRLPIGNSAVVSVALALVAGIAMLGYWMNSFRAPGQDFFSELTRSVKSALATAQLGNVDMVSVAGELGAWVVFVGEAGWTLLLVPTLGGVLYGLRLGAKKPVIFLLSQLVVLLLVIIYGSSGLGSDRFLPARWIAFLYVPACLLAAGFLSHLLTLTRIKVIIRALVIVLTSAILILMVTSPGRSIPDSPLYAAILSYRPGFYLSEVSGLEHAERAYEGTLAASSRSQLLLTSSRMIDPRRPGTYESADLLVVTEYDNKRGFGIPNPEDKIDEAVLPTGDFLDHLSGPARIRVYDGGSVHLLLSTRAQEMEEIASRVHSDG